MEKNFTETDLCCSECSKSKVKTRLYENKEDLLYCPICDAVEIMKKGIILMDKRKPIAHVEAVVRFDLFDGDYYTENSKFDWFQYREPGITTKGDLAECVRKVVVLSSKIVPVENGSNPKEKGNEKQATK